MLSGNYYACYYYLRRLRQRIVAHQRPVPRNDEARTQRAYPQGVTGRQPQGRGLNGLGANPSCRRLQRRAEKEGPISELGGA